MKKKSEGFEKKLNKAEEKQRKRVTVCLKLDQEHDAKVIEQLRACPNKQGYIKKLILDDLTLLGPYE